MSKPSEIAEELRAYTYQYEDHPSNDLATQILELAAKLWVAHRELRQ